MDSEESGVEEDSILYNSTDNAQSKYALPGSLPISSNNAAKDNRFFPNFMENKLVRIQYPGIVENVDKAISTLGGMDNIEFAASVNSKKLQVRFRPDDRFCKPAVADKDLTPGVLLKVKIRQPKVDLNQPSTSRGTENGITGTVVGYEVVGVTAVNFTFNRVCDFQYLPMTKGKEDDKEMEFIHNKIVPDKLPDLNWLLSEESRTMPYYFTPPLFSNFDKTAQLVESYENSSRPELEEKVRPKTFKKKIDEPQKPFLVKKRQRKYIPSVFCKLDSSDVPQQPRDVATEMLAGSAKRGLPVEKVKKLFEERPIWSKTAVCCKVGITSEDVKFILPAIAYHCPVGPWRAMWVKFGYDPRQDPSSRVYQTFDFRVRTVGGLKVRVQTKRNYSSFLQPGVKVKRFSLKGDLTAKVKKTSAMGEECYILKPGMIPPGRQMFYQYCDIRLPEIEAMFSRLPDVPPDTKCDPKNGWLPLQFHDQCREIANKYIVQQVKKEMKEEKTKKKDMVVEETEKETEESLEEDLSLLKIVNNEEETIIILDESDDELEVPNLPDQSGDEMQQEQWSESDSDESVSSNDYIEKMEVSDGLTDEDEIDLEAVEEINRLIGTIQSNSDAADVKNIKTEF